MTRSSLRFLLVPSLLACTTNLDVPPGAEITCSSQDDCPDGRICARALGRCVPEDSDGKPPTIVSLVTSVDGDETRKVAAPGARIQIAIAVDEALGRPPAVELAWTGASASGTEDTHSNNDWTFVYDVLAADAEGFVSIIVTVVDEDGLPASMERPRELFIDKTPAEISVDWSALVPAADNPLSGWLAEVDAGCPGSLLVVGLLLNEPVRSVPTITAVQTHDAGGDPITGTPATFDLDAGALAGESLFSFEHTLAAPLVDGTYRLETTPTDEAGNPPAAPLVLSSTLVIDAPPPPQPPDVDTPGLVRLQRIPWGSAETAAGNTFPFMVVGSSSAAEAQHAVIAYADDSRRRELETGRGDADIGGAFGFSVGGADRPVVWLTQVDAAGNESAAARVNDVTWIATIGPESPHDFEARTWIGSALEEGGQAWQSGAALAPGNTDTVPTSGLAPGWERVQAPLVAPPGLFNHAMAYDFVRGRVVVHGGSTETYSDQTWEWDGQSWELACGGGTSCDAPVGAVGGLAFDSARGEVVLFGGDAAGRCADETWAWNGERWYLLHPGGAGAPAGVCGTSAAYDAARGRLVLFGGFSDPADIAGSTTDALWEWDGQQWTLACGGSSGCSGPSARRYAALAFDPSSEVTVLFGGSSGSGETWTWDGTAWDQRCDGVPASDTCASSPGGRTRHAMTSDQKAGVWLFGGGAYSDELWSWDGDDWQLRCGGATTCSGPSGRRTAVTFDAARGALVLFGGSVGNWPTPPNDETWEWHDDAWVQRGGASTPRLPAIAEHSMVYSRATDRAVLQTGAGETWEWDGALGAWQLACGGATGCIGPTVESHAMVYDPDRDAIILFGGIGSDQLQTFDGNTWSLVCGTDSGGCIGPNARYDHAIAYDAVRHEVIVFGGYDTINAANSDQTWVWDPTGGSWRLACGEGATGGCTGPSARTNAAMAFDEARGVAVLHGGNGFDDTWEWDGSAWQLVCSARKDCGGSDPTPVWNHTLTYSSHRGTVLLFGGIESPFISFDLWEWNGSAWTLLCGFGITGCVGPSARAGHAAAYDRQRGELLVAGGDDGDPLGDTWRFRDGAVERPAHVASFIFGKALENTANAPDPFRCLDNSADCLLRSITVRASATGLYDTGGGVSGHGIRLLAWQDNAWRELDTYTGSAAVEPIVFTLDAGTTPDPVVQRQLGGLLLGRDQAIHLALTPDGDSGALASFGAVETDTVELEVRYRLP
jgi:hypothetical protein